MSELRKSRLTELEAIIEVDMMAFVRVGNALVEIRNKRLYEERDYDTFTEYLKERWEGYARSYFYNLMDASQIIGYLESKNVHHGGQIQTNERVIRPLAKLATPIQVEKGDANPEIWADAWIKACESAKPGLPTESHVKKAVNRILKNQTGAKIPQAKKWTGDWKPNQFYLADITTKEFYDSIPKESTDLIITDPPYAPDDDGSYSKYEALGKLALKALKPAGFCCVYLGKLDLPILFDIMQAYLDYEWCYAVYQPQSRWNFRKGQFKECWRPIGIFRKPGDRFQTIYFPDAMESQREKDYHEWQQGIGPALQLIKKYTSESHLILEPFCGGGTIPIAAAQLKRNFIAFDNDETALESAQERMQEWKNLESK